MIRLIPFSFLLASIASQSSAQNFTGQWKGSFIDKSASYGSFSGDKCDYVLDLEVDGGTVSGTSYTYFTEGGKRYFTICNVTGNLNLKNNYIEIQEISRTKTNIPSNVNNCFQVHKLNYLKQGNTEMLEGNWVPAKNQNGNCGFGITSLTRRTLSSSALYSRPVKKRQTEDHPIAVNTEKQNKKNNNPYHNPRKNQQSSATAHQTAETNNNANNSSTTLGNSSSEQSAPTMIDSRLERKTNTLKTIEVRNNTVKVDLYDNGDVDGDSISLFFNNKLLFSGKRLTENPISINLNIDDNDDSNELVMYAENLGAFPPNTALMVVTDGRNRYEVRISSDLERSGLVRFVRKK